MYRIAVRLRFLQNAEIFENAWRVFIFAKSCFGKLDMLVMCTATTPQKITSFSGARIRFFNYLQAGIKDF